MRMEYQRRVTSLDLLAMPRIWFAFWARSTYCWLMLSFSLTNTYKSVSSGLLSINSPHNLYFAWDCLGSDAVGLTEIHDICFGPSVGLLKVPLDGIPPFQCVDCTTQFAVVGTKH